MYNDTRYTAFCMLYELEKNKSYSNLVLNNYLKDSNLSIRDKNLSSSIFYGVIEKRLTLDYIIKQYSNIPVSKIDIKVLIILRMAVYQLLYMDKIPNSAAVNEGVNLTKKLKKNSAAGFVNAILRSLIRNDLKEYLPNKNSDDYLEIKYSVSNSIISLFRTAYGEKITLNILNSLVKRAKIYVRVNTLKNSAADLKNDFLNLDIKASECDFNNALILDKLNNISNNKFFTDGRFHVQSLPSQICASMLNVKENQVVFDVCSAPGGKAFTLAQLMNDTGKIFAFDLHEHKIKLIDNGAKRLSINIINACKADSSVMDFSKFPKADRVLCDVPCSGLGTIKKKPEIKYKDISDLNSLYKTQYKILCNSSEALKNGGVLVYSTCTLNPEENNKIADKFLQEHNDFKALPLNLPSFVPRNSFEHSNQVTIFPFNEFDDGFFIASFKRIS